MPAHHRNAALPIKDMRESAESTKAPPHPSDDLSNIGLPGFPGGLFVVHAGVNELDPTSSWQDPLDCASPLALWNSARVPGEESSQWVSLGQIRLLTSAHSPG